MLTGSLDAELWQVPTPLEGGVEHVVLWTQVLTGMELNDHGAVRVLDAETWHERRQRLRGLGDPPLP
jgi:hypothetical protein